MFSIENRQLKVTMRSYGAELQGIIAKPSGEEFLWNGDPQYWKYSSPVLFPIVGKLVDDTYKYGGKEYKMNSHGLARVSEFELVEQTQYSITFALQYNEETLKIYPFKFRLEITYILRGTEIEVYWRVQNLDAKEDMYFSIGAHPAFRCPLEPGLKFEDYYLEFSEHENLDVFELAPGCLLKHDKKAFSEGKRVDLKYEYFDEDARIFERLASDTVMIRSDKGKKAIGVRAQGFPFWGIWSPAKKNAPFVCIEPWLGHADYADFKGEFQDKEGVIRVPAKETFEAKYYIIVEV